MKKKSKKEEHIVLDSSLPSEGHPMAAWPGIGHTRPKGENNSTKKLKKD